MMRVMRLLALLVLTVAAFACGGSGKPVAPSAPPPAPDPIPTTVGPDCKVVADKLAIVVHAAKPDAQASASADLRTRCADDKWSDEARSCFATVESDTEIDGCKQHLTDAQKPALEKLAPTNDAWSGGAAAPAAAPAPAAKPEPKKRSTRGATPKTESADPQEGGE
jgi:hypothetical protein